jgi:hypothetical protein
VKVVVGGMGVEVVPDSGVKGVMVGKIGAGDKDGVFEKWAAISPSVRDSERLPRMIPLENRAIESPHRICRAIRILFLPGCRVGTRNRQ